MGTQKVKVPQKDGEISVSIGGNEPTRYRVTDGEVSVKEEDVDRFVAAIVGSERVAGNPSAGKERS